MQTVEHPINNPSYYDSCSPLTRHIAETMVGKEYLDQKCIEVIEYHNMSYHLATALAYLWRAGQKEDARRDLEKAKWFLERKRQLLDGYIHPNLIRAIVLIDELLIDLR